MASKLARRAEKHAVRLEAHKARRAAAESGQAACNNTPNSLEKRANTSMAREVASLSVNPTDNLNMNDVTQRRTRGVQIDWIKAEKEMLRDDNFDWPAKQRDEGQAPREGFYRPQTSRTKRAERAERLSATTRNSQKNQKPPKNENSGNTLKKDDEPATAMAKSLFAVSLFCLLSSISQELLLC